MESVSYEWPSHFVDLKRKIVSATTPERLTASWNDVLAELTTRTVEIAKAGPDFIPQVNFTDLDNLTPEQINVIRRKGSVVIHGIVDSKTASSWKTELDEFVKANPEVKGFPEDKQFFYLYWTRPQVQARAHPNVLKASAWLNNLYRIKSGKALEGVDLSVPLTYADRFRIRHPGGQWGYFPPHVDGVVRSSAGKDDTFRRCFDDILTGDWRKHDPYDLECRLDARSSLYGRRDQATVFRTLQGWLAMSEIAPTQGTLRIFPDIQLSNAYTILRPFFRPTVPEDSPDILDPKNWKFDISTPDFPGISHMDSGFVGPLPTPKLHPHLRLDETMTSIPKVFPGDMVFWHCDVVHSVETEHTGNEDSAVIYIGTMPKTPHNLAYVTKQAQTFLVGQDPPDFAKFTQETTLVGLGSDVDVKGPMGRVAMGLLVPVEVA